MAEATEEELRNNLEQGGEQAGGFMDPVEERDVLKLLKMLEEPRVRNAIAGFISLEVDAGSFFASARVRKEIMEIVNETKTKEGGCCNA